MKFEWKDCHQNSFEKAKEALKSDIVLINFNPEYEIVLATDASEYGLGTVLSHKLPNGEERPISYASRLLNNAEKNYSVIEKEALAVVWATKKFLNYLEGHRFTLYVDHKPLIFIFGNKKKLSTMAASRIHR